MMIIIRRNNGMGGECGTYGESRGKTMALVG
jgi:hypothetical protein